MIPAAIGSTSTSWRRRAGVGAAAALGVVAIASGMSAGLETSARWTNDAQAAVIPEVLYLEEEMAQLATIARVNGDIVREVTVDVRVDDLARRRTSTETTTVPANTLMANDGDGSNGNGGGSGAKDEATEPSGSGADNGAGGSARSDEVAETPAAPTADNGAKPAEPGPAPRTDEPAPTPTTAPEPTTEPDPARGNGAPQNDKPKAPERDPKVDGKSTGITEKETTTP